MVTGRHQEDCLSQSYAPFPQRSVNDGKEVKSDQHERDHHKWPLEVGESRKGELSISQYLLEILFFMGFKNRHFWEIEEERLRRQERDKRESQKEAQKEPNRKELGRRTIALYTL